MPCADVGRRARPTTKIRLQARSSGSVSRSSAKNDSSDISRNFADRSTVPTLRNCENDDPTLIAQSKDPADSAAIARPAPIRSGHPYAVRISPSCNRRTPHGRCSWTRPFPRARPYTARRCIHRRCSRPPDQSIPERAPGRPAAEPRNSWSPHTPTTRPTPNRRPRRARCSMS
jgi:hypothetical protein